MMKNPKIPSGATIKVLKLWAVLWILILQGSFSSAQSFPRQLGAWLRLEQTINDRDAGEGFAPLDFSELPVEYDPKNQPVWDIGYLEIPFDQALVLKSEMSESAREILLIPAQNGKPEKVRFFLHPYMESHYAKEISQFGLKRGEYLATPTSSPRSLLIWKKSNPKIFTAQKVSLDVKIGGVSRVNSKSKLLRAFAISQAMREIPAEAKKRYNFDVMLEPMVVSTKDKNFGNITRDLDTNLHLVPGFALAGTGPGQEIPMLVEMINRSGLSPKEFIENKILRPLISAYSYLTFAEGLVGEPHQQNVLFEIDAKGDLTGKVVFRDLDAYKADLWLRHLQGRPNGFFSDSIFTAKDLNLDLAHEAYGSSYLSYIRQDWDYLFKTMFNRYSKFLHNSTEARDLARGQWLGEEIDKIYFEEARSHLGTLEVPYWIHGQTENDINKMVAKFKSNRFLKVLNSAEAWRSPTSQKRLGQSYAQQFSQGRTTLKQAPGSSTLYSQYEGMTVAIDPIERQVGYALNRPPLCRSLFTGH